jgi:Ala-tRNA(Pro) deacylase
MILEKGRPEKEEGRLEKEIRVYDFLDRLGIEYERIDHEEAMTMEACEEIDRVLDAQIGSSRLSFAKPEYMEKYLDVTPGSVSVLGLMNDREKKIQLLIDKDVLESEYLGCHPCMNTTSMKFKMSDFTEKILPALGHEPKMVEL